MFVECVNKVSVHYSRPRSRQREVLLTKATKRIGPLEVSPMGLGTWSWGNKFLWDYSTDMDPELNKVFNYALSKGINLFDTADSYGEILIPKVELQ